MTAGDGPLLILILGPILTPLALLGLFCFLIQLGIKKGSNGLVIGSCIALYMVGAPAACMAPFLLQFPVPVRQSVVFTIWYIIMGVVWSFLAFSGLKYSDELMGKAMLVFSILWTFMLTGPLIIVWKWTTAAAFLMVVGLTALGYIVLGVLLKSREAARRRKESRYKRLLEEVDGQKAPWDDRPPF